MGKWSLRLGGIQLTSGAPTGDESADPETPFRILVMGDFTGAGHRVASLGKRKPLLVDRDNLDEVLAKLGAKVKVPRGSQPNEEMDIVFQDMEDFEPDRLFEKLPVFEHLGDLQRRLRDPARFADAAAEIKGWATARVPALPAVLPSPPPAPVSSESLLEQLLNETATQLPQSDWDRFLHKIVAPHVVANTDPRLPDFEAAVAEASSAQMRAILHHPDFQRVEAAWRGLFFLVRRLETDEKLKLYILDATKEELAADLNVEPLNRCGMYEQLVEKTVGNPGAAPWAVVAGMYTFGPTRADLELLGNLGRIASRAGAPFLAAAHPLLLGCSSLLDNQDPRQWQDDAALDMWNQLRDLPEANYLGLTLPRLLLRLPYGKDGRSTERFALEEMPPDSPHENYLWGNGALACALLLGQSFSRWGWNVRPGQLQDIEGLPLHIYEHDAERLPKPCAEVLLSNRALEAILDRGLMSLASVAGKDAARLVRFQSIALPAAPLAGRWQ